MRETRPSGRRESAHAMKHVERHLLGIAVLALLGCSSGAVASPTGADATPEASDDASTTQGPVLDDFEMAGYVRWETSGLATDATFAQFRLYDLRAATSARYALIHTAGFWCSTCVRAANDLVAAWPELHAKALFIEILTEGTTPTVPATKGNLDAWVRATNMPFTAAVDVGDTQALSALLGVEDMSYLLELPTMRIVDRTVDYAKLLDEVRAL